MIAEDLIDRDYVDDTRSASTSLQERVPAISRPSGPASTCGLAVDEVVQLAREYGTREAGRDPPQLRHAAPRGRRHGRAHHRLPAGAHRRLARCRGRHRARPPRTSTGSTTRGSSGPTCCRQAAPARDQPFGARRRADFGASRRCARSSSTTTTRSRCARLEQGGRRLCARGPASPW